MHLTKTVRDKSGNIKPKVDERKLNGKNTSGNSEPSSETEVQFTPAEQELDISLEPPSQEEIKEAIKHSTVESLESQIIF